MRRYSEAVKADIKNLMTPPARQSVVRISEETGIHICTLYPWRKGWRLEGDVLPASQKAPEGWSAAECKLLIIDELGYLPLEPDAAHLFFQLISRRYDRGSVLITSNRPVREWGEVFGDQVVATAILDRLLHHSPVLTVRGDSYRMREKCRSGLIKTSSAVSTIPATGKEGSP